MKNFSKTNPKQEQLQKDKKRERKEIEKNRVLSINKKRKQKEEMNNQVLEDFKTYNSNLSEKSDEELELMRKENSELLADMTATLNTCLDSAMEYCGEAYDCIVNTMKKLQEMGIPLPLLAEEMEHSLGIAMSLYATLNSALLIEEQTREKAKGETTEMELGFIRIINSMTGEALEIMEQ